MTGKNRGIPKYNNVINIINSTQTFYSHSAPSHDSIDLLAYVSSAEFVTN